MQKTRFVYHIFISYSRKDLDIAWKIVQALEERGLDVWLDWQSIPKGENWEQEIYNGIEGTDVFLFLISPDSVRSEMCNKEIAHAIAINKRILPILLREIKGEKFIDPAAEEKINELNWIFCRQDQDDFDKAIDEMQATVRTDFDWVRLHTRLLVEALEWEKSGKDSSRLLRGKELKEAEAKIDATKPKTEPLLTEKQRQYIQKSRQSVNRRRALPYQAVAVLALIIFISGKFYFLILPISSACPQVTVASIRFDTSDPQMPDDLRQRLEAAADDREYRTSMRNCEPMPKAEIQVMAEYNADIEGINLQARLPETPAYRMDFLQEIREFGPQPVSEQGALKLFDALLAYSVGDYPTVVTSLEGEDNLTALTLTAQAQLFTDDLKGSQETYELALQNTQTNENVIGKLYMGAALAWWRPESYYFLSTEEQNEYCPAAGNRYAKAQTWIESSKAAENIRIVFADFCLDPRWMGDEPFTSKVTTTEDDIYANAIAHFIYAIRLGLENVDERDAYKNHLALARPLRIANATLSDFYWGVDDNCMDARKWREVFNSGIISQIEKKELQRLLQMQPLFC